MNTPDDVVCDHDECEGRFCNLEVEALYDERDALIVETQELRARLAATPIPPVPAGAPGLSREGCPMVRLVKIRLCDACLAGEGEECHTPGCALWIHDSPGHPIPRELYEIIDEGEG